MTDAQTVFASPGSGDRIRTARVRRGLTQAALAAAVGVSRSAVAQWETGRAGQVHANLVAVATALGVSVGYLFVGSANGSDAEGSTADAAELALLRLYRDCTAEDRQLLLQTAVRLARRRS